jgi:hypothetical protein
MYRIRWVSLAALVAGLALGAGALAFNDAPARAAPEDDIAAMLAEAQAAWNAGDVEGFLSHWTDKGLMEEFEATREELTETLPGDMEELGEITSLTVSELFVTSGNANGIVEAHFESGFSLYEKWSFLFQLEWLIDGAEPAQRETLPAGVTPVDLRLQEYAFVYDADAVRSGNFAFQVSNIGEESHEVVIFEITSGDSLGDVVESIAASGEEETPEGVEFITFGGFFDPGEEGTTLLPEPLDAGSYGLICFVPAPDGTPHAFLGMVSEFTVGTGAGGGGTITPPSTGDGGLVSGAGTSDRLLLAAAATLTLAGAIGLKRRTAGA